jgi:nucleoside-diphosphate-sugar epimerase
MTDRVLVTGARGFIGARLVAALADTGAEVISHGREEGDVASKALPYEGVTHVFHLAARTRVPESWNDTFGYYQSNVMGAVNVLEFCRKTGCSSTFLSSYVYGEPEFLPISESHPVRAFNPYSHTKILAEHVCRYYASEFGLGVTVVRPFNVFGPGQSQDFLISKLVAQAADPTAGAFHVFNSRPKRDYLYIDDLIELLVRTKGRHGYSVFNAGSGSSTSIAEVVAILNTFLSSPRDLVSDEVHRPSEVMDVVADINAARLEFGWTPSVTLKEGLRRTFAAASRQAVAPAP